MKVHHFLFKVETVFTAGVLIAAICMTIWLLSKSFRKRQNLK
jgi:hypothetical protein